MKRPLEVREITIIGIFVAVTVVLAQVAIPLPFTPVPISFGLVAVYTTGILLKPKHAVFTQVCYLLLGAMGAPVFGNFRGGIGALFGPTGGYLMVYPAMAGIVSMALNSRFSRQLEYKQSPAFIFIKAGLSICIAHIVLYLGGTLWFSITTGISFRAALAVAVYPFIPLDIFKIVFCIVAVVPFRSRMLSINVLLLDGCQRDGSLCHRNEFDVIFQRGVPVAAINYLLANRIKLGRIELDQLALGKIC